MKISFGPASYDRAYGWLSILEEYKKNVRPDSVVLEIGASVKRNTALLARCCKKVYGVELYKHRMPENFDNVEYVNGNWQELTKHLKKNSIDIAFSTHVIEHVEDDLKALNELYEVLKPGGVALLNTPNRKRLTRSIIELVMPKRQFPYAPLEHVREYIEPELIEVIEKSKFKKNYSIKASTFGLHSGYFYFHLAETPKPFRHLANFWEIHLQK